MKKPQKMLVWHWYCDIWKTNIYLCLYATNDALASMIKGTFGLDWKMEYNTWYGKCLDLESDKDGGGHAVIIALREFKMDARGISTLTHEAFHATEYMMETVHIKHCEATSEVFAYTQDSIVRWAIECMKGKSNKPPRYNPQRIVARISR